MHDVPNIHNDVGGPVTTLAMPVGEVATRVDPAWPLRYCISGGQTGADQAGLRAAHALGYTTGGMAPKDFRTDEGLAPWLVDYGVRQHPTCRSYGPRTWWNVRASNGTVWFGSQGSPGYQLTKSYVEQLQRHWLVNPTLGEMRQFIIDKGIVTLNIAGNRERINPGIGARVEEFLLEALKKPANVVQPRAALCDTAGASRVAGG